MLILLSALLSKLCSMFRSRAVLELENIALRHQIGILKRSAELPITTEDSGFCVLRVKASGHCDVVTVVGTLPSVSPGEWMTAEGTWFREKEYGLQLKATTLRTAAKTIGGPHGRIVDCRIEGEPGRDATD